MAGYKCVNFADLCRLCAGSGGGKTGIFSEDGKRKNMLQRISECLRIKIHEKDRLPKGVCVKCLKLLESLADFKESVTRAQGMLESCLSSTKLKNGGMVYIKDDSSKEGQSTVTTSTVSPAKSVEIISSQSLPTLQIQQPLPTQPQEQQIKLVPTVVHSSPNQPASSMASSSTPTMAPIIINSLPKGFVQASVTGGSTSTAALMAQNSDFLSSIIQAVGIQAGEAQQQQQSQHQEVVQQQNQNQPAQYTITLDGQTIKANQIHYKIQDSNQTFVSGGEGEPQTTYTQMDEFLKIKTPVKTTKKEVYTPETPSPKKPKISVLIKSPQAVAQPTLVTPTKPAFATASTPMTMTSSPISITPISSAPSIANFTTGATMIASSSVNSISTSTPVKTATAAIPVLDAKAMMQGNKCVVPIMLKTEAGGDQIALAPIANMADMSKSVVPSMQYVQMKLQPGPDGMFRLAPAQMPPALTLTPQGLQQFGIQPLQTVQAQQQQQIQIQPQQAQLQSQLAMPSVQLPLSNYLSLVEKSAQVAQATNEMTSHPASQANLVITTQPVQQQPQQPQQQQQLPVVQPQVQQIQIVQRPSVQTQSVAAQPQPQQVSQAPQPPPLQAKPKVPKPSHPPPSVTQQQLPTKRPREPEDLNSSTESIGGGSGGSLTAQSIAATQQMKAISALSIKQDLAEANGCAMTSGVGGQSAVSFTACDVCSKSFKRKEHLMQHLKSHVGLRPFKCEEAGCSKSFSRKEHLMRHTVSHSGKKLFACPVCRKYFSRKDNLNKHKKTHQDNSSSAPFSCTICKKGFYIKTQFLKHKQVHDAVANEMAAQKAKKNPTTTAPTKEKPEPAAAPQPPPQVQQTSQTIQIQQQQPAPQQTQPQLQQATLQQQQPIFTIPAQIQNSAKGGQIIQIAMPNHAISAAQQQHHTIQTISGSNLAAGLAGAKTAIIKSADGSSATVYTIPSNFIISDGTQFLGGTREQQQQLMGNIKIEQIT